jgi:hypothetical protein
LRELIKQQVESLRKILGIESIRRMAVESGFCERKSKLSPEAFFDLMFYASSLSQNVSLAHLTSYLESAQGIRIQKQSLDERFSPQKH